MSVVRQIAFTSGITFAFVHSGIRTVPAIVVSALRGSKDVGRNGGED